MALADGTRVAEIHSRPIHFRDASDRWRVANPDLRPLRDGTGYSNTADDVRVRIPRQLHEGLSFDVSGRRLRLRLIGATSKAAAAGSRVRYPEALDGVDVVYRSQVGALKEDLVLKTTHAPTRYAYELTLPRGTRAQMLPDGGIAIIDRRHHRRLATVPPPFLQDAAGTTAAGAKYARLRLLRTGDRYRVVLKLARDWITASSRRFPVKVDPSIVLATPTLDCEIASTSTTSRCGTSALRIGYDGVRRSRALLRFGVESALPNDAEVLGARLGLHVAAVSSGAPSGVTLHEMSRPWTSAVTWTSPDGAATWATPGGDHPATPVGPTAMVANAGQRYHWSATEAVRDWIHGWRANNGFLLKASSEATARTLDLAASEDPARGPVLEVHYAIRTGNPPDGDAYRQRLADGTEASVDLVSGNLVIHERWLTSPGRVLDLPLTRSYNSRSPGWHLGLADVSIDASVGGDVVVRGQTGERIAFARRNDGSFAPPRDVHASLTQQSGDYAFTDLETGERFTGTGGPFNATYSDESGVTARYTELFNPGTGLVDTIAVPEAVHYLDFDYNQALKVGSVRSQDGGRIDITYGTNGSVTQVTSGARTNQYEYDASGLLSELRSSSGAELAVVYDASGRVRTLTRTDAPGAPAVATRFEYEGDRTHVVTGAGAETVEIAGGVQVVAPDSRTADTTLFDGELEDDRDEYYDAGTGPLSLSFVAKDDRSGLREARLRGPGGEVLVDRRPACLGACPRLVTAPVAVQAASLAEGAHAYTAETVDDAANRSTDQHVLLVDRTPPSAPSQVRVEAFTPGSGSLVVGWEHGDDPELPTGEAGSGVASTAIRYATNDPWDPWSGWVETRDDVFAIPNVSVGDAVRVQLQDVDDVGNRSAVIEAVVMAQPPTEIPEEHGALAPGTGRLAVEVLATSPQPGGRSAGIGLAGYVPVVVIGSDGQRALRMTDESGVARFDGIAPGTYTYYSPLADAGTEPQQVVVAADGGVTAAANMPIFGYRLTEEEKQFCNDHLEYCPAFHGAAARAFRFAERLFTEPNADKTRANSFQHAYWVASMVEAIHRSPLLDDDNFHYALEFSFAHESESRVSEDVSARRASVMDIRNNRIGYNAAVDSVEEGTADRIRLCARIRSGAHRAVRIRFRPGSSLLRRDPGYRMVFIRRNHPNGRRVRTWPQSHFGSGNGCIVRLQDDYDDDED